MQPSCPVVLYRYDTSVYSHKIDHVLAFKRIPYHKLNVSATLPRPEIEEQLGIAYRRIPILAIGNDVYCDTSLIVSALERRFPSSSGFGLAKFYAEGNLSRPFATFVPWDQLPPTFLEDRKDLLGISINPEAIIATHSASLSLLSSHFTLIEEQLADSREWLFATESPSLADISVHCVLAWGRSLEGAESLFDSKRNPLTLQWFDRLSAEIKKTKQSQSRAVDLDGNEAASKIFSAGHEPYDIVGFNTEEASLLNVALNDIVQVTPEDTGRNHPTSGKLVALNLEEVILEVQGPNGLLRCHFPRLGFSIKQARL